MLEEGVSDHRHERVTMKTLPGPPFEVVEAKFLFQLLMGLLADPSRLDCGSQVAQVHLGWQVGKIVFLLSRQALLTDEPSLITWKMLLTFIPYPLRRSVGGAHADSSKSGFEPAFRPASPAHIFPLGIGQHVFSRYR